MLSAWHEQGGNVLQRHLDGHPQLYVAPFETQLATPLSSNILAGPQHWVPQRYCWPEFSSETTALEALDLFWDEEMKTYLRAPSRSKFKDCGLIIDEKFRKDRFFCRTCDAVTDRDSWRRGNRSVFVEAFFRSTFDAWTNFAKTGKETHYVGYSPPILFDTDKILSDFPSAHIVHIVRNPFSGYADTKKRPFPMSLTKYAQVWNHVQLAALTYQRKYPSNFMVIRYESLIEEPRLTLNAVTDWIGLERFPADQVIGPSFNRKPLVQVFPWGTIKTPTVQANIATANELSHQECRAIETECGVMCDQFGYANFKAYQ